MNYTQLLDQAKTNGVITDKKMSAAMQQMSCDLKQIKEADEHLYWNILRRQHEVFYERHYSEKMANHDVNNLVYSECDEQGEPAGYGPHWSVLKVGELTRDMKFHPKVNHWDKYVAFNAMYADLSGTMNDEDIIKAAYAFYFCDADWQQTENDCTKIWDYMSMHAAM